VEYTESQAENEKERQLGFIQEEIEKAF